nr:hypothetical protein BaRGS_017358 [Batillaria attramentaria]
MPEGEEEEEEEVIEEEPVIEWSNKDQEKESAVAITTRTPLQRLPSLKKKDYGVSLILSNVPMSPKVINGSFAALFENSDVTAALARHFQFGDLSSHALRLSPRRRGKLRDQTKQLSLDYNFFASKPRPLVASRFKQSSLDSKIDDILEVSSIDSDANGRRADSTDNLDLDLDLDLMKVEDGKPSNGVTNGNNRVGEKGKVGGAKDGGVQFVNGHHPVCKHCGMAMDDD